MTEREKIIEVIKKAFEDCGRMLKEQIPRVLSGEIKKASDGTPPLDEAIADALIAAGIGDISKWQLMSKVLQNQIIENSREEKHRAEVAERALRSLAQLCAKGAKYYLQSNEAVKERERELYDEWIKQAEKELQEGKNEQV